MKQLQTKNPELFDNLDWRGVDSEIRNEIIPFNKAHREQLEDLTVPKLKLLCKENKIQCTSRGRKKNTVAISIHCFVALFCSLT